MLGSRMPVILASFLALASVIGSDATELVTDFDQGSLDREVWDDCQVDRPALRFEVQKNPDGSYRRFLRIPVDRATRNINDNCQQPPPVAIAGQAPDATAEPLGPSLALPSLPDALGEAECKKGSGQAQRNELRLTRELMHPEDAAHWYSLTFRADGNIPACGSARWIIGQWKQDEYGPSPFLAQRFDNGVLHVTVQNNNCRCVVAKAAGDFDAFISAVRADGPRSQTLRRSDPIKCIRSDVQVETSCNPSGMSVLTLDGDAPPALPDPKQSWVTMTYFVRGGGSDGKGRIDVYANNRFVVRVEGMIGYKTPVPDVVKFKLGHYRDQIDSAASISVDRFCVSPDRRVCAPELTPVP